MIERKIKELSIALEALSRIQGMDAYYSQICNLLQSAIDEAQEMNKPKPIPESGPNDDIPF